jgi:uncharacterized protein YukE
VILRVNPTELTETARPLRDAVRTAREFAGLRGELDAVFAGVGAEPARRAAQTFLDAWTAALQGVSERAELLVGVLDTAAADYAEVEDRMRHRVGAGPDGGAA